MTQGEKNRMIHIRLEEEVHKDLRKAAAEEDTSLQELVSRVVSRTVAGGKLVEVAVISGDLPEGAHSVTVTMQDGDEDADMASLRVRFQEVERLVERLGIEVRALGEMLGSERSSVQG